VSFLLKVAAVAGTLFLLTRLDVLPGLDVVPNPDGPLGEAGTYLWIGLIFGLVNAVVGPILRFFSLPFVLVTLGLFLLIINAALLGLTAALTDRLQVDGFVTAVLGGLILAVVTWIVDRIGDS
jgi:putative membrane protein